MNKKPTVEQRLAELEKEVAELWENKAADSSFKYLEERIGTLADKVYSNTEFRKTFTFLIYAAVLLLAIVGFLTLCGVTPQ